uniref:trimeric intracellular cation channel family protein n=1 Tax=uncultured Allobacillus sp. TaxID=1638025 RepID=UPI002595C713|nr:trimeric intracellular cation channel family protein [uncultured Allobacillus sp.]
MTWEVLNIIGTMAFAISGAIVAMEEKYDIFGVYLIGYVTAFGGGAFRNLLVGLPISDIWAQGTLFTVAFVTMTIMFLIPFHWLMTWNRWGAFFDAIGLASFAVQGGLLALAAGYPLSAVIVAGVLTGCGGGIIRDLLAGRKPMVLHQEIYAMWAVLGAFIVGLGVIDTQTEIYILLAGIVMMRSLSIIYKWELPSRLNWLKLIHFKNK